MFCVFKVEDDEEDEDDNDDDNDDEPPPENEIDLDKYDIKYEVERPTSSPEGRLKCEDIGDIGQEGELDCEDEATPRSPYKQYKKYKTWKRRPLFVIIIGGWV